MENQTQVFHASHRPLKIPQNRRDFHISTATAYAAWKSGKPKIGFPLFHPAHAMTMMVPYQPQKPKERKAAATRPTHSPNRLSLRSSKTDFMLILRLENA